MHSYRKQATNVWQVVFYDPNGWTSVGPTWDEEFLAAAFACFLNGGRYSPGEIESIFPKEYPNVADDDSIHPDRPDFDYAVERRK